MLLACDEEWISAATLFSCTKYPLPFPNEIETRYLPLFLSRMLLLAVALVLSRDGEFTSGHCRGLLRLVLNF